MMKMLGMNVVSFEKPDCYDEVLSIYYLAKREKSEGLISVSDIKNVLEYYDTYLDIVTVCECVFEIECNDKDKNK